MSNPIDDDDLMHVGCLDHIGFFPGEDDSCYDGSVCGWDGVDGGDDDEEDDE